jgi:acyl dehydratase
MVEVKMTAEERAIFEEWRSKIGQEFVPPSILDQLGWEIAYFYGWNEEEGSSRGAVTKWAIANEDFNALWFDEEYAKKSTWGGVIAPPLFLTSICDGLQFPTEFCRFYLFGNKLPTFERSLQALSEWEFFEPVRIGDKITFKTKLVDVHWKQGREYRLLFMVDETIFTNQKGQLVANLRAGAVHLFNASI